MSTRHAPRLDRPEPGSPYSGDDSDLVVGTGARTVPEQYEQLLTSLARAEEDWKQDDCGRTGALEEASSIVFDLLYALDFKRGGELVPRLAGLYGYIGNQLLVVGKTKDRAQLAHLREMVTALRQSWFQVPSNAA